MNKKITSVILSFSLSFQEEANINLGLLGDLINDPDID